jgi:hypothetical protein
MVVDKTPDPQDVHLRSVCGRRFIQVLIVCFFTPYFAASSA